MALSSSLTTLERAIIDHQHGFGIDKRLPNEPLLIFQTSSSRIVNIFRVKVSRKKGELSTDFNNKEEARLRFGTVSEQGTVTLWHFKRRAADWIVHLHVPQTIYGDIIPSNNPQEPPLLFIQSREVGIRLYRFEGVVFLKPEWESNRIYESIPLSKHIGFCKMEYYEGQDWNPMILFPEQQASIVMVEKSALDKMHNSRINTFAKIEENSTVMFMKVFTSSCPEEGTFVLYGLEDGTVKAASICPEQSSEAAYDSSNFIISPWESQILLNHCGNKSIVSRIAGEVDDDLVTPTCGAFVSKEKLVVIGTNTKKLFILKTGNRQFKFEGKKTLINTGISCMLLHTSEKLLVTGGWDGFIRLFGIPTLNQIQAINFHMSAIQTLYFIEKGEEEPNSKSYYLLAGASNGIISCWNLYPSIQPC